MCFTACSSSIAAAFRERVHADVLELGLARRGRLSAAGRRLAALEVEEYTRAETARESEIRGRASLHGAHLLFSCSTDEDLGVAMLEVRGGAAYEPPSALLRVRAYGRDGSRARVRLDARALSRLESAHLRTGLDPRALVHAFVGYLCEFTSEEWELHERLAVDGA